MEQYKQEFIEFMVESDVLKFGEFTLKSGRQSPFFMNAGAYVTGTQLRRLGEYYAKAIHDNYGELELITGFGADKTMTAVISGSADIGFMGSEASIYTYNEGANDYVVNFAQLTQRAGNFLVAREEMPDFTWDALKGTNVLGGRKGVRHYIM